MRTELVFHLARKYLVSAAEDDLRAAPDESNISFLIDDPEITGEEEAFLREGAGGLGRHAGIAAHHVRTADGDDADRLGAMQRARHQIHRLHFPARERAPDRADSLLRRIGGARDRYRRSRLGQSV